MTSRDRQVITIDRGIQFFLITSFTTYVFRSRKFNNRYILLAKAGVLSSHDVFCKTQLQLNGVFQVIRKIPVIGVIFILTVYNTYEVHHREPNYFVIIEKSRGTHSCFKYI